MRHRATFIALVCFALSASVASASWYDDYDAGIKAARAGQWSAVVDKMSKSINGNGKENNSARTYGAIFINYHPYYYRGVANLNLGKYEQAITDFEKTSGPGELDLGPIETLIQRAKSRLEAANTPVPQPVPEPQPTRPINVPAPQPQPPVIQPPSPAPVIPSVDNSLRVRAQNELGRAKQRLQAAQQRKATTSLQYASALQQYTDANSRLAAARSNDELNAIIAAADNIGLLADSALAPAVTTGTAPPTRPVLAVDTILADSKRRLRQALESYFRGDFDEAAETFDRLSRDMPTNAWVWAFLGASKYSLYAFEADETYKSSALDAFRRAKQLRSWKGGLPEKYFSRRIRNAFNRTEG